MKFPCRTKAFRRTAERRNKRIRWPISPTEKSAKLTPFRVIAPLDEKCTAYLAKKLTFATPGPTSRPLGSHATLYDYCKEVPLERNGRTFRQWATRHQIPPQEAIQIELEAASHGLPLGQDDEEDDQRGMTFRPGTTMAEGAPMAPDPRQRRAQPLVDAPNDSDEVDEVREPDPYDIDTMAISGGVSLSQLQRAGIVHKDMTQTEFDARLRRIKLNTEDRMRLAASAFEQGYFTRDTLGRVTLPGTPGGSTLSERNEDRPLRLPTGRVANLQASRAASLRDLQASVERLNRHVHKKSGLTLRAVADREGC